MPYQPIENYGVIGDLHTVALVGMNGSIDFMSFPHFDSPTVFAACLTTGKGTVPDCSDVCDLEPQATLPARHECSVDPFSVRRRGWPKCRTSCRPRKTAADTPTIWYGASRPGAARLPSAWSASRASTTGARHTGSCSRMTASCSFRTGPDKTAPSLVHGSPVRIVTGGRGRGIHAAQQPVCVVRSGTGGARRALAGIVVQLRIPIIQGHGQFWHSWVARSTYRGRWREVVNRSALTLKLLTSRLHGSVVAAATFGLPRRSAAERNWDYRYTWIRDASFTLYGLIRLGYTQEAGEFMKWIEARSAEPNDDGSLQIMYGH